MNPDYFIGYGIPNFQFALTLGHKEQSFKKNGFVVFPNPVVSNLSVKFPHSMDAVFVSFHNLLGHLIYKTQVQNMQPIDVEALSKGLYFLTIQSENQKPITFKILKN